MHTPPLGRTTGILLLAFTLALVGADSALAREKQRSGSYVTSKGRTGTFSNSVSGNYQDGVNRRQSVTTDTGQTYERTTTTQYNRDTSTVNRSVTSPNGNTREGSFTIHR